MIVDGIDYSADGIETLREEVIKMRNQCLDFEKFDANGAVVLSHVIAVLHEYISSLRAAKKPESTL